MSRRTKTPLQHGHIHLKQVVSSVPTLHKCPRLTCMPCPPPSPCTQDSGVVSLADLAISYTLNTELLIKVLSSRIGSSIQGKLDGGLLYTPAYVRNIKSQLRGALRGCTSPLSIPALVKDLGLEGVGGGGGGMVSQLVESLVQEGAIKGTLKSGGVNWVPAVFTAAQQEAVRAFYQQNGWVGYDTVRKAGISNEKGYLKTAFPEGMALDTAFVSPGLLANLEASVEETLMGGSWLDAATLLPPALSAADVGQLLGSCQGLGVTGDKKGGDGKKAEVGWDTGRDRKAIQQMQKAVGQKPGWESENQR